MIDCKLSLDGGTRLNQQKRSLQFARPHSGMERCFVGVVLMGVLIGGGEWWVRGVVRGVVRGGGERGG